MAPPNCKKASLLADFKGASSQCGVNLPVGMAQGRPRAAGGRERPFSKGWLACQWPMRSRLARPQTTGKRPRSGYSRTPFR